VTTATPIRRERIHGTLATSSSTVTVADVPGGDYLYLLHMTIGKAAGSCPSVSSVAGLGLTWALVKAQCSGRNTLREEVW